MPRRRFTEKEVVGIVARQIVDRNNGISGFMCSICGGRIFLHDIPEIERDHTQPLGLGGEDTPQNCTFVHGHCHKHKTHKQDKPIMDKADRQSGGRGSQYARRKKRTKPLIQGRTFQTNKDGKWKAKINARTEPRT